MGLGLYVASKILQKDFQFVLEDTLKVAGLGSVYGTSLGLGVRALQQKVTYPIAVRWRALAAQKKANNELRRAFPYYCDIVGRSK